VKEIYDLCQVCNIYYFQLNYNCFCLHSLRRLVGGKGESHANIAEGLATALQCFEDLQQRHKPNILPQKHCTLVCNSPPYLLPVMESAAFAGHSVEQLGVILQEVSEACVHCCYRWQQLNGLHN
jgi:hypothetical protein